MYNEQTNAHLIDSLLYCSVFIAYASSSGNSNSLPAKLHKRVNLKSTGHVIHHQFNIQQLYALSTLYLCVLYLTENKQRLVPLTP
jgi:hypothetical protein